MEDIVTYCSIPLISLTGCITTGLPKATMKSHKVHANGIGSNVEMVPPDGGWGWMVVVGNCFIMFMVSTISFGYGVVYVGLVEQYGISNTAATGITALILGITSFMGPFATALATYYSHRCLAMIGVICTFTGLLCASLWINTVWLYLCFIVAAFGNAMATPQTFMIGQKYFVKNRVTVNSIASMSFTLGYVLIPVLLHYLIDVLSVRGTFMIWAGLALNGAVGASLYEPVQRHLKPKPMPTNDIPNTTSPELDMPFIEEEKLSHSLTSLDPTDPLNPDHNFRLKDAHKRVSFLSAFSEDSFHTVKSHFKSLELLSLAPSEYFNAMGSVISLNNIHIQDEINGKTDLENGSAVHESDVPEPRPLSPCLCCGFILPGIFDILQVNLIKNPVFLIVALGSTLNRQIYYGYLSLLPVVANNLGFKAETPILLLVLAVFEVATKFFVALAATMKGFPKKGLYMAASLLISVAVLSIGFLSSFVMICIGTACLGIGTGLASCIGPVLLVEYLGIDLLPYSYGMVLLMSGILSFIIFPLQGLTIDLTGSTTIVCVIFSILAAIAFILWLFMPLAQRIQKRRELN